ncbi:dUTP diphosphatase [Halieaceae bacterium IMCC14734]|uniref:dUTP diphosphatase n=1 Tax=Candidatus Litorirhabdus singularis TaxID=2518993 RepID=A0ABT3THB2_9GAMM|nr:dUTP diphosphatase [Candidatus Litorirhabdus singularis]MCX2981394.1 dUTP diphosphatase [Candidatus Litorirhabdus singularis]
MKQALINMLEMQHRMNTRVHESWIDQNFEWYRAVWIECGELMDHYGYKWWKQQNPDIEQVRLEIVDIWHFGMSAMFRQQQSSDEIAAAIVVELQGYEPAIIDVREATERLAAASLNTKGFSVTAFWDLLTAAEMSFESLYRSYVGKNVLNFFRQDNGYKDGSYRKLWLGREDNEHLVELAAELDAEAADYADRLYQALDQRYQESAD